MANWFLDLFRRPRRRLGASAKFVGRGSALTRPRSRLLARSRISGITALATRPEGPAPTGREFSDEFSEEFH